MLLCVDLYCQNLATWWLHSYHVASSRNKQMQRERLTAGRINALTCPTSTRQFFLWDTEMPRLAVRATAGSKSFIFESKLNRKTIRWTIGDIRAWRIDDARSEARRLQTLIDQGIDPREVDRQRKAEEALRQEEKKAHLLDEQRQHLTFGDAWLVYIEARRSKWGERHLQDHVKLAQTGGEPVKRGRGQIQPGPLAILLPVRLSELTQANITAWAEKECETRPARVALARRLLIGFASWCKENQDYCGLLPDGVFSSKAVRESIPESKAKDDCLQREQLAAWFNAVCKESPVMSTYLQILLLTGARREELAGLRWSDIDFQWASMTIKDKVEGERTIPLTPYVSTLLSCLPRRNEWVFSSPAAAGGRIVEPRIAHNHALKSANIPNLTLHGLRRSFGTLAEWIECPTGVVAQIMGHKPSAIAEKHYRRRSLDLLRMWHTRIESWILNEAGIYQN